MAASEVNISIEAGTDFFLETTYVDSSTNLPQDVTGYKALLEVRDSWENPIILFKADETSQILLGGANGLIAVHFLPTDSSSSTQTVYSWTRGVYHLTLTDISGIKTRILTGYININNG